MIGRCFGGENEERLVDGARSVDLCRLANKQAVIFVLFIPAMRDNKQMPAAKIRFFYGISHLIRVLVYFFFHL